MALFEQVLLSRTFRALAARRWALLGLFAGILAPLAILSMLAEDVWEGQGLAWDTPILQFLYRHANPRLDTAMIALTTIGGPLPMIGATGVVLAILLWLRRRGNALFFAVAVGGAAALNFFAKLVFQRARPGLWETLVKETDYSFPSGHAMGSMAFVAALVFILWPTRWRWVALVAGAWFVIAVGFSRIYLGVHFPSDILAGWSASLVWVVGVHLLRAVPLPRRAADWRTAWAARRQHQRALHAPNRTNE